MVADAAGLRREIDRLRHELNRLRPLADRDAIRALHEALGRALHTPDGYVISIPGGE